MKNSKFIKIIVKQISEGKLPRRKSIYFEHNLNFGNFVLTLNVGKN